MQITNGLFILCPTTGFSEFDFQAGLFVQKIARKSSATSCKEMHKGGFFVWLKNQWGKGVSQIQRKKITMQVPSLDAPFAVFIDVHGVIFKRYKVHSAAGE